MNFLPGEPNRSPHCVSFTNWNAVQILSYCSGNNLVITTKDFQHLQTIYLPGDSFNVDINRINGKIAISIDHRLLIYSPSISNFYNFNFGGRKDISELKIQWNLELEILNKNDSSHINCFNWSDSCEIREDELDSNQFFGVPDEYNSETSCELVVGSEKSLTLWRLYYKNVEGNKTIHKKQLWFMKQPNPIYFVKFSPNSVSIASIGFYDRLVKVWRRLSFGIETSEFELNYIPHQKYITSIRWKQEPVISGLISGTPQAPYSHLPSEAATPTYSEFLKPANNIIKSDVSRRLFSSDVASVNTIAAHSREHNVLYTLSEDSVLRVFTTCSLEKGFKIISNGSLDLYDGSSSRKVEKFVSIVDHELVDFGLNKILELLDDKRQRDKLRTKRSNLTSDLDLDTESLRSRSDSDFHLYDAQQSKLSQLLESKIELCIVFDNEGTVNVYGLSNLNSSTPTPMATFRMSTKTDEAGKVTRAIIKFGDNCIPKDCRMMFIQDFQLSEINNSDEMELSLVIHDLFKNSIRHVGISFEDLFQFEKEDIMGLTDDEYDDCQLINKKDALDFNSPTVIKIGELQHKFTGHNKSIQRLIRSTDGSAVLSVTRFNESCLWMTIPLQGNKKTLNKKSTLITPSPIIDACIWKEGNFVITLVEDQIICFDCRLESQYNEQVTKLAPIYGSLRTSGKFVKPLCFFLLPESDENICHIVAVYENSESIAWEIQLIDGSAAIKNYKVEKLPSFDESTEDDKLHDVTGINPVGWTAAMGDKLERDVLSVINKNGLTRIYSSSIVDNVIKWNLKDELMTGIENASFLNGSSVHKLVVVNKDSNRLTIWDTRLGILEYDEMFEDEVIKDLDWTATESQQGILAVGFRSHSILYTQLRYDYTNQAPTFAKIKRIDIGQQTTHEIGDSIWMTDGLLVIGSGNQFYISDKSLNPETDHLAGEAIGTLDIISNDIFHLCSALNGPLPLYHPQNIIQVLFTGRIKIFSMILIQLSNRLREFDLGSRKRVDAQLGINFSELIQDEENLKSNSTTRTKNLFSEQNNEDEDEPIFTKAISETIIEKLQKHKLPYLTGHQQITLASTIQIVADIMESYQYILDLNGLRFYLGVKLFQLNLSKTNVHRHHHSPQLSDINILPQKTLTMRDITFALHSDNKDLLMNMINEQCGLKIDSMGLTRYGLSYWLENDKLVELVDKIAKNEFFKFQEENKGFKDPTTCSIYYLALKKKKVLLGLWRTCIGHPQQQKMINFLKNDFKQERWRSAAMKNAFVLLGKHRYTDAASFFLLADSVKDSVNVIISKLKNIPMAIAIARCYEGCDDGPAMRNIILNTIIPRALECNNRWKISWCFTILGNVSNSMNCLIKPMNELTKDIEQLKLLSAPPSSITNKNSKKLVVKSDLQQINNLNNEDPVLLIMYESLRSRNIEKRKKNDHENLNNNSEIKFLSPVYEYQFILKVAAMYEKMGCDYLALSTVKNWKFILDENNEQIPKRKAKQNSHTISETETEIKKIESEVKTDTSGMDISKAMDYAKNKIKPPPSAFVEPDMSAFDFGF